MQKYLFIVFTEGLKNWATILHIMSYVISFRSCFQWQCCFSSSFPPSPQSNGSNVIDLKFAFCCNISVFVFHFNNVWIVWWINILVYTSSNNPHTFEVNKKVWKTAFFLLFGTCTWNWQHIVLTRWWLSYL